jgi:hypothetical protein
MFDFKISGIAAGLAFILSFLVGMVSGASFPALLVRPLIFGVLAFLVASLVYLVISRFLPELMDQGGWDEASGEDQDLNPGSRVNITENEPSARMFLGAQADDSEDGLGDISSLAGAGEGSAMQAAGMDLQSKDGYTKEGDSGIPAAARREDIPAGNGRAAVMPEMAPVSDNLGSMDILPDLDSMAGAFLSGSGEEAEDTTEYSTSAAPAKRPSTSAKGQKMEGDFNPKELAAGIRTILKKEG